MAVRTLDFLPSIFRTPANQKFLNATLEQATSDVDLVRINGYVGRKFTPTYKVTDNYLTESDQSRANYQLEPTAVVKTDQRVDFLCSYTDLINCLGFYGAHTDNHDRLFSSEFYNFDGHIDYDKFVNFSQYYWLPNGPDAVDIITTNVDTEKEFVFTKTNSGYFLVQGSQEQNPIIYLARGGNYTFRVEQTTRLWIQTETGVSGVKAAQPNISSREVLGVSGNGASQGEITFTVPQSTAQDFYVSMPRVDDVDLASDIRFKDLQGATVASIINLYGGIDGQKNIAGKSIIILNDDQTDWLFDGSEPSMDQKYGVWQVNTSGVDQTISLVPVRSIPLNHKVRVREGTAYNNREFYKLPGGFLGIVPVITAAQNTLYYQDESNPALVGEIRLIDPLTVFTIDVVNDILGRQSFSAPNGVVFTNGLKIKFDSSVTPSYYQNTEFYVEGVGTAITLVRADNLVTPESYTQETNNPFESVAFEATGFEASQRQPVKHDYIVINRASQDGNAWSRGNRWFHIDVIKVTADYNNFNFVVDQTARAQRPIIEFDANLRLFDSGTAAKQPIDLIDLSLDDILDQVEGQPEGTVDIDGVTVISGMRILFTNDADPETNNRIYQVELIDPQGDGSLQLHLVPTEDSLSLTNETVAVRYGSSLSGKQYWYNGVSWNPSQQQKTGYNQSPRFDVFDQQGVSLSDASKYPGSTFQGTKIFGYRVGTGPADRILGFPLSYRTIASVGDILFENYYATDTFTTSAGDTQQINSGSLHVITGREEFDLANTWKTINHPSEQFQIFSYDYNGTQTYLYEAEYDPDASSRYLRIYAGNQLLDPAQYSIVTVDNLEYLVISDEVSLVDKNITVQVYKTQPVDGYYYQIPANLDNNSLNEPFGTVTLGQLRNHYTAAFKDSTQISGSFPGSNNSRDLDLSSGQGTIVQHSSGVPYAMLFLTDDLCNFASALDYNRREYTAFKNKFLEIAYREPDIESLTADQAVDRVLSIINDVKTSTWPWYYSDTIPTGELYTDHVNVVTPGASRTYRINSAVEMNAPSSTSVLLFLNDQQLLRGIDYEIDQTSTFVTVLDSVTLSVGDQLIIREYASTDGCYVPETPTKLGLYPKYTPAIVADNTYVSPVEFIRGHDGSMTPRFGDHRDDLLLELEKRIYNNIKVVYDYNRIDRSDVVPGQYRQTDYTRDEITQILGRQFARWVGNNRLDYTEHDFFDSNNPFTWNYKSFKSAVDGDQLLGHWRAIFNYMYDTEHPDTRPWEMLGFGQEPEWWQDRYGPAPYTSGNLVLWEDLEAGRILEGPRAGLDSRYARPGLLKHVPVDEFGQLRAPSQFLVKNFNGRYTQDSFGVGDQSPTETAWRNSSEYPFAIQMLLALTKPARYFGLNIDTSRYVRDTLTGQYLLTTNRQRPAPGDILINGIAGDDDQIQRASGYINWISDYVRSLNINPATSLKTKVANLSIQLSYKMAGFSDKKYLKAFAEQNSPQSTTDSVLIPDDDYELVLKKSVPLERLVYSAVVVERTINGYRVEGYDIDDPFFNIIPSLPGGSAFQVNVLGATATVYTNVAPEIRVVPYGTEFATEQQVFDFLISYGRYLESRGFEFTARSDLLNDTKNWNMSAREFLTWAQHRWGPGNIIVLSPVSDSIDLELEDRVVDRVSREYHGARVLDQNFALIKEKDFLVNREGNSFNLTTVDGRTIALAVFSAVQYEHVFLPNNATVFNDVIYQPELGHRQGRIRLVGFKTGGWTGNITPSGFILNQDNVPDWRPNRDYLKGVIVRYKDKYFTAIDRVPASTTFDYTQWTQIDYEKIKKGLIPNFTNRSSNIENYYNTDDINLESDVDIFSKGLIGYRTRDYFNDLGLDDTSQIRFYQGYIKQKGTRNAITALTRARLDNLRSDISYYEEWAFRTGEYGAIDLNQMIEIQLDDSKITNDVSVFQLLSSESSVPPADIASFRPSEIYRRPDRYNGSPFITRGYDQDLNREINKAGYVRLDDVDFTLFNLSDLSALDVRQIGVGSTLWTAVDFNNRWNVFRVCETGVEVTTLTNLGDGTMRVQVNDGTQIGVNDVVVVRGFDLRYDGAYRVLQVSSSNDFVVLSDEERLSTLVDPTTGDPASQSGLGAFYRLKSVRYLTPAQAASGDSVRSWRAGDKIWVDQATSTDDWGVFEKTEPWSNQGKTLADAPASNGLFGAAVYLTNDDGYVLVGAPGQGTRGLVQIFERTTTGLVSSGEIDPGTAGSLPEEFGHVITGASLDSGIEIIAIGSPNSQSTAGQVDIVRKSGNTFEITQTFDTAMPGDEFGYSLSMSRDARWLYVGSPGSNQVYAYAWDSNLGEYALIDTLTYASSTAGDRYGHSVYSSSDGSQVTIGAPGVDNGATADTGAVYIYDRSVEAAIANGTDTVFTTQDTIVDINGLVRVTVDLEPTVDYTISAPNQITFVTAPAAGAVLRIDTNVFRFQQMLTATTSTVGSNFGRSLVLCSNDCSLYVGNPNSDTDIVNTGSVARFVNQARVYGSVDAAAANPTISIGDTLRINDFVVEMSGTTVDSAVDDINSAGIPGVSAIKTAGNQLGVRSDSRTRLDRLRVSPGTGTAFDDFGFNLFVQTQVILQPEQRTNENFGEVLALSDDANTLYVGAPNASMFRPVTVDGLTTTFDVDSTRFGDLEPRSGTVYVFEYLDDPRSTPELSGQFGLVQELVVGNGVDDLAENDLFGTSLAVKGDYLVVGAVGDDQAAAQAGAIFDFASNGLPAWQQIRQRAAQIETDAINRVFLYSIEKSNILTYLDIYDPAKGRILGQIEQDLDYISSQDPASYNNQDQEPGYWDGNQAGRYWWDTASVRYLDYEQGDHVYRMNHWGRVFPGSEIVVYEWVDSDVLPSQFVDAGGVGTPKYPDDSHYVISSRVDADTGIISTIYYYWVGNRNTTESTRHIYTTQQISQILENPRAQNIAYAAILSPNTIGIYNINQYISGSDTVLAVDYDLKVNQQVIHAEFQLVQEGNPDSLLPDRIVNKLFDSLCGQDVYGNPVPQANLPVSVRYGLKIRPRQTIFVDRQRALKVLVDSVNRVFAVNQIAVERSLEKLLRRSPVPTPAAGDYTDTVQSYNELLYIASPETGERVLVEADEQNTSRGWAIYEWSGSAWVRDIAQTSDTTLFWDYKDWYDTSYDPTSKLRYSVNDRTALAGLALQAGDTVKIRNRGDGLFEIIRITDPDTVSFDVVGVQNGTIELLSTLYTGTNNATEIRNVFEALRDDIFIKELAVEFNRAFFLLVRLALIEQKSIDWAFKTSFISIKHRLRSLEMFPGYQVDNQSYLEKYIEEVKPYRTKIREYLLNYDKVDPYGGYVTDFDLPAYYDSDLKKYRSPNGEVDGDVQLWQEDSRYQSWYANYEYSVIEIRVERGGSGYTSTPVVEINGGGGSGATATARISAGSVVAIFVTNPGQGYNSTPTVSIIGGNGTGAQAYAQLGNDLVRSINTHIKFDRIRYGSNIAEWAPNSQLYTGNLLTYRDQVYKVAAPFITGSEFADDNLMPFDAGSLEEWAPATNYAAGDFVRQGDDVYRATADFSTSGSFEPVTLMTHTPTADPATTTWQPFVAYSVGTVVEHQSLKYLVTTPFVSGPVFSQVGFESVMDNANDRARLYYSPKSGMPGSDLTQLYQGIEYPGVQVDGLSIRSWSPSTRYEIGQLVSNAGLLYRVIKSFVSGALFSTTNLEKTGNSINTGDDYYDTVIQSYFTDADLGQRPEDIDVDGGAFVDRYSSHSPEEFMPGRIYDSLDIQVYSINPGDFDEDGAGADIGFRSYSGDGATTEFVYSDNRFGDSLFVYTALGGYQQVGVDYTQDYVNKTITFATAPGATDQIYIYVFDSVGDGEIYRNTFVSDGSTTDLDLSATYDLVKNSYVKVNGAKQTLYTLIENSYGLTTLRFTAAPAANALIDVHLYSVDPEVSGQNTYSEAHTQTITLTGAESDRTITLDRPVYNEGPWSANIIVEINGRRLRPANNGYYLGDGTTTAYYLSDTISVDPATISDNDIEVYLNGHRLRQNIEYEIIDGSILGFDQSNFDIGNFDVSESGIVINFYNAPALNDRVVISHLAGAEFRMANDIQIDLDVSVSTSAGDTMRVHSFSNHDNLRIRTQVFTGVSTDYTLSRPCQELSHLWVTHNGQRLLPNFDFAVLGGNTLEIGDHVGVEVNDVVVVTHFTENLQARNTGFRIHQDTRGMVEYLRISDEETTTLREPLALEDTEILIEDALRLSTPDPARARPGVVYINKERITYYTIDRVNNKLGQIRRGTGGTGALALHPAGSRVVDAGVDQIIPTDHVMEKASDPLVIETMRIRPGTDKIWYDLSAPTEESSLQFADTVQARFLREKHAYYVE